MNLTRYTLRGWPLSDYIDFAVSLGSVFGAFFSTLFFTIWTTLRHIPIPQEVYSIPIGFGLFSFAWIFDSIAHRSIYKNKIDRDEFIIHQFMVYGSGFPLFVSFVLAYWWPGLMMPFIGCFLFLKTMYSLYDEFGFHWPRFRSGRSDIIEMTAHAIQFGSNVLFDIGFLYLIYWNHYACIKEIFIK